MTSLEQATRAFRRRTVFEAIDRLLEGRSWSAVSMAEIAAEAGASRATLYNEFGSRDELLGAYAVWASESYLEELRRAVDSQPDDLRRALVAGFERIVELASGHPLLVALEGDGAPAQLHSVLGTPAGVRLVTATTSGLTSLLAPRCGALSAEALAGLCEVAVRLAVSHVAMPTGTPIEAARQFDAFLGPHLDLLGTSDSHLDP